MVEISLLFRRFFVDQGFLSRFLAQINLFGPVSSESGIFSCLVEGGKIRLEGFHGPEIQRLRLHPRGYLRLHRIKAHVDDVEERSKALVDIVAVLGFLGGQGHLFEVAEGFEAVTHTVLVALHGNDIEFTAPSFRKEHEKQPVKVHQPFFGKLPGQVFVTE